MVLPHRGTQAADQIMRRLAAFVIVMLLASAGGLCWLHRASIASSANDLSKRRSVVDVVLWASGSKETFNRALSKGLDKAQADTEYQFQQTKPKFKSQFDGVDFSNLSDAWNGKRSKRRTVARLRLYLAVDGLRPRWASR